MGLGYTQQEANELVDGWFKEFEEEDKLHEQLLKDKKIKPEFDFMKNKYLEKYGFYCPKFIELRNTDSIYAIEVLWEIKDFKRPLSKRGLSSVMTNISCKNCKGITGKKACEMRCLYG